MDPVEAVLQSGGIARYGELREVLSRADLSAAIAAGRLIRAGHGRYALPTAHEHLRAAAALSGVLGGLSAAMFWGWKVKTPPPRPQVVVPRGRKIDARRRVGVDQRWMDVSPADRERGVLGQVAAALDCARTQPFDAALAVMDSALRDGGPRSSLLRGCEELPRTGRARALRVVELGDRRAANPFEFHSARDAMLRDMERYNAFLAEGYRVLRFGWEHAMFQQDYVREAVTGVLATFGLSVRGTQIGGPRNARRLRPN